MISEKFIVQAILQPATTTGNMGKTSLYIAYNSDPDLFQRTNFLSINPGDTLYLQSAGGHATFSNVQMKVVGGIPPDLSIKAGAYWHTNDVILPIGLYYPLGVYCNVSNVPFSSSIDEMITYNFPNGQKKEYSLTNPPIWDYKGQYEIISNETQQWFYKNYMLSTYAIDIDNIPAWKLSETVIEPEKTELSSDDLTYVWNSTTQSIEPAQTFETIQQETKSAIVKPITPVDDVFEKSLKVSPAQIDTVLETIKSEIEQTNNDIPEFKPEIETIQEQVKEAILPKSEVKQTIPVINLPAKAMINYSWLKYAIASVIVVIIIKKLLQ